MKFLAIAKRVSLFLVVNLLVLVTISMVLHFTGLNRGMRQGTYQGLMLFCLIWGMGGAFISLGLSRLMARWMMGVRVIDPNTREPALREVVEMVHGLARRAGLPKLPQVGYYESADVNAFATGPSKSRSLVAVSTGLLRQMNRREVEGVLAHEVAHIANGDMVTMTLVQGVINAFVLFFARILATVVSQALRGGRGDERGGGFIYFILVMVFDVVLSLLGAVVVCWFSRWREFRADAGAASLSSRDTMISALRALQRVYEPAANATRDQTAAFQALKISGRSQGLMQLFATHPPLAARIARLEAGQ